MINLAIGWFLSLAWIAFGDLAIWHATSERYWFGYLVAAVLQLIGLAFFYSDASSKAHQQGVRDGVELAKFDAWEDAGLNPKPPKPRL